MVQDSRSVDRTRNSMDPPAMPKIASSATLLLALSLTTSLGCFGPRWGPPSVDPNVLTIGPATFGETSGVTEAVRDKCKVQEELPEEIASRSPVPVALAENTEGAARLLNLEITSIFAPGGGRYSGAKQIVVHGEIVQSGQVTASFDVKRTTTRATRTCAMLDKIQTAISKDVNKWLKNPKMGAQLGEMK
jgi:hypothetical protein